MKTLLLSGLFLGLLGLAFLYPLDDVDDDDSDSDSSEHGVVATDRTNNCTCGWANKDDQRIVGGKATKVNEYPMMAGFVYLEKDQVMCGGTIVTPRHIITAAHCTEPYSPYDWGIYIGHHNYEKIKRTVDRDEILLEPEEFFVHEQYDSFTLVYDISIVFMKKPMQFNENVGPACLPKERTPLVGERVKVLGWGLTKYKGAISEVLLKVNIDIQPFEQCSFNNIHLELNDKHQICTYRKNKDSCSGDSGGPLLWRDPDTNRYTLIGSTSYGTNCAKYPAVNSDIYYFLPWIQRIISQSDPSMKTCAKE
uniref:Venom S1 protease 39 n=1 Tax=Platymeris rhadamanthus TaxID=1134088 RepID=A0A6B9L6J2_PLARH|nr:venom S1 protease 39 [Platymeris rhadamanthus]